MPFILRLCKFFLEPLWSSQLAREIFVNILNNAVHEKTINLEITENLSIYRCVYDIRLGIHVNLCFLTKYSNIYNQTSFFGFLFFMPVCLFFPNSNPILYSSFQGTVKYNIPDETDEPSFNLYHNIKQDQNSFSCKHTMKVCGRYVEQNIVLRGHFL